MQRKEFPVHLPFGILASSLAASYTQDGNKALLICVSDCSKLWKWLCTSAQPLSGAIPTCDQVLTIRNYLCVNIFFYLWLNTSLKSTLTGATWPHKIILDWKIGDLLLTQRNLCPMTSGWHMKHTRRVSSSRKERTFDTTVPLLRGKMNNLFLKFHWMVYGPRLSNLFSREDELKKSW